MSKLVITLYITLLLSGCSGSGGGKSTSSGPSGVTSKGIPNTYQALACMDVNADMVCDTLPAVALDKVYDGVDLTALASDARVLVELSALDDIGATPFIEFGGKRYLSLPAGETDASGLHALAFGLLLKAQGLQNSGSNQQQAKQGGNTPVEGIDIIIKEAGIANISDARNFLKKYYKLDGSGKQNEAIFQALVRNLETLGTQGLNLKQAYDADIKAMAEELVNLTVQSQILCIGDKPCITLAGGVKIPVVDLSKMSPRPSPYLRAADRPCYIAGDPNCDYEEANKLREDVLLVQPDKAVQIAYDIRAKADKPADHELAFEKLSCEDNEIKQIYMYGVSDGFSTNNVEATHPSASLASWLNNAAPSAMIHPYDYEASFSPMSPNLFADTLSNLPTDLSNGMLAIGLKEKGLQLGATPVYLDVYTIGDIAAGVADPDSLIAGSVQSIRTSWGNPTPNHNIYVKELGDLQDSNNQTLLAKIQAGQNIDMGILMTTNVDFIALAACRPKPDKPKDGTPIVKVIETLKEKFQCNAEETYMEIAGGNPDDFTPGTDVHTPSSVLLSQNVLKYDSPIEKAGFFGDTLTLPSGVVITKAQFMINARPSTADAANDAVGIGHFDNNPANSVYTGFDTVNPNGGVTVWPNSTLNGGTAYIINGNYQPVLQIPTFLSLLNSQIASNQGLDVLTLDQTEVDTTLLQLCVGKEAPCPDTDGDGWTDCEEEEAGSDPNDSKSTPDDLDGDGVLNGDDCNPTDPNFTDNCGLVYEGELPDSCKTNYTFSLIDANTWVGANGSAPVVHNQFSTYSPHPAWANVIWHGDMDNDGDNDDDVWFNFGSASNTDHKLNKQFCACGGVEIKIEDMKSDNTGYIDIINNGDISGTPLPSSQRIVSRTAGHSQETMASWGPIESGSYTATGPSPSKGINYDLEFGVHNYGGPSGGSVRGTLAFIGHEGVCTDADVIGGDTGGTNPVGPVINVGSASASHELLSQVNAVIEPEAGYIKLDHLGNPLSDQTQSWSHTGSEADFSQWSCVKDTATNLIWEVKQGAGLHQSMGLYRWYSTDAATNGGNSGATGSTVNSCFGYTAGVDSSYCNTQAYVQRVNNADFCGAASGWRMPTKTELEGLMDSSFGQPTINGSYFPNTGSSIYWSGTSITDNAWMGNFFNGSIISNYKGNSGRVRLVRD